MRFRIVQRWHLRTTLVQLDIEHHKLISHVDDNKCVSYEVDLYDHVHYKDNLYNYNDHFDVRQLHGHRQVHA